MDGQVNVGGYLIVEAESLAAAVSMSKSCPALENTTSPNISIRFLEHKGNFLIQVSDNGYGIPESKLDRVFIPFFTTKKEGSGIGLSVSRQIMNLHGGHIEISSIPDEKTTITLVFAATSF